MRIGAKVVLLLGVGFLLLVSSCKNKDASSAIMGKWGVDHRESKYYENGIVISNKAKDYKSNDREYYFVEFKSDHTYDALYPNFGSATRDRSGTFSVSGDTLSMFTLDKAKSDLLFSLKSDTLTLSFITEGKTRKTEVIQVLVRN